MVNNKRGWIRILEATIAVIVVSAVLILVYSQQSDRSLSSADYFYSLQREILADIALRVDLRLAVLSVGEENEEDLNFMIINDFVDEKVPDAFDYYLRICDLGSEVDFCKMDAETYIMTRDEDVFVEDLIIAAELGDGSAPKYNPKKLRFFIWESR